MVYGETDGGDASDLPDDRVCVDPHRPGPRREGRSAVSHSYGRAQRAGRMSQMKSRPAEKTLGWLP